MLDKRQKIIGRKSGYRFVMLRHDILEHPNYINLSAMAKVLLTELLFQFNGANNGDLCVAQSILIKRGWTSKDVIQRAKTALLQKGWIVVTRQGGLNMGPILYALTFLPIDYCGGKLDRRKTEKPLNYWKQGCNPEITSTTP